MPCVPFVVSRMDRVKNEVCRRAGLERELAKGRALILFVHVERMDEYHMASRVLMADVSGGRVRGRPGLGWMNGVKVALGCRGMMVEAARSHFSLALRSFGPPTRAVVD